MDITEGQLWEYWQKYIADHYYSPFDIRVKIQFKALAEIIKKAHNGSIVLDIGAGENVLEPLFKDAYYISLDSGAGEVGGWKYQNVDILGDVLALPVANSSVDIALLVWVLEHVNEPYIALQEIHRILKPGGILYLLAPLFLHEHMEPYDFYRYTRSGLKYLLKKACFGEINIKQSSGVLNALSEIACFGTFNILSILKKGGDISKIVTVSPEGIAELEEVFKTLNKFHNSFTELDSMFIKNDINVLDGNFPTDYVCIAYKPGDLNSPEKYQDKKEVLKNILACPQCHLALDSSFFESGEAKTYHCKNCNKRFEFTGNNWQFIYTS